MNIEVKVQQVCVASPIFNPVQQHQLSTAASLCSKFNFSSCPAASTQYCSKFLFQVPFSILSSSIHSILQQFCVSSSIFHPVQQHQLSTAASLCFKFIFSSCPAASTQYCSKFVFQVPFSILSSSINSVLQQVCVSI